MARVEVHLPKVSRRRLVGTLTLSSTASLLFLAPGLFGWPGASLPPLTWLAVVIAGPFLIGMWSLLWAERRIRQESLPVHDDFPQRAFESERDKAGAR